MIHGPSYLPLSTPLRAARRPLLGVVLLASALPVAAFTYADGTTGVCIANEETVIEVVASADDPQMRSRTGLTAKVDGRWRITWNAPRLQSLPPEVRDFLFFHECAHARAPTEVELEANCAGLIDMRAAGRATPTLEAKLRGYFGKHPYWEDTFACADAHRERMGKASP
jgi:hypothetical protein